MKRTYFGTDGVRGRVGSDYFTPDFVLKLGWAAGRILGANPDSKILIGKDTRISGYMFESALEAGLTAAGVNILMLGPMPSPGIAYLTHTLHAQAGIVISASHNPYEDNGIKFFSADGDKLPDSVELQIEEELTKPITTVASQHIGKAKRIDDAAGRYIEFCKSTFPKNLSLQGLKIVIDCAHGAAYHIAPNVFEELDAEVISIGCQPNGLNINAGVGATAPLLLQQTVLKEKADLGIALDGDGDRLIMVNRHGQILNGDSILYIIARSRQTHKTLYGPVVGTVMSNIGLEIALKNHAIKFERTKVGDRYILERLKATNGILGGEPSGHIICKDRLNTGDGIIAALQVLAVLISSHHDLDALLEDLRIYPQRLVNVQLPYKTDVLATKAVQIAVQQAEESLGDTGRVLLRLSGTEPLLRVMVEGQDEKQVDLLVHQLAATVRESLQSSSTN